MKNIYLDYNATAPIRPEVIALMSDVMKTAHNASSVHSYGRTGRSYIEDAREQIATLTGAPAAQIIFNSGATEGNNTVLHHFAEHFKDERILVSAIEHPSILDTDTPKETIPVLPNGLIDLDALETMLEANKTALVSVMLVNNETGVIQPTAKISALAHKHGALFHADGVQAAGRININMAEMGIDFLTLSAHKLGGPQGVGALCLGLCGQTPTLLQGGGQEKSARAGTENVAGIAGFGLAAEIAQNNISPHNERMSALRASLEENLSQINALTIHGQDAPRAPNTCLFTLTGLSSETLMIALDLNGIAVSNGSACSSGRIEPSHVLKAMGISQAEASSAIRISLGYGSKQEDIDAFAQSWQKIMERMKDKIDA